MGKKGLVKETIDERELARQAEEEKIRENQHRADQMRKDLELEAERRRKEEEQEMEKKRDLIRQIRAMEKVPVDKTKPFDPSEPPNQGYMEEMSLAELRERLEMVKSIRTQELEDKRERQ